MNLCRAFCFMHFPSLIKKVVSIPTLLLFCAFYGKIVIQKTKKNNHLQISAYNHNIYSLAKIKSCINKPVEHINRVLSLDFEFPCVRN